jgi:hypothetical protein
MSDAAAARVPHDGAPLGLDARAGEFGWADAAPDAGWDGDHDGGWDGDRDGQQYGPLDGRRDGAAAAIRALYAERLELDAAAVPVADPDQHTMGEAVDDYVAQRVPTRLLDGAVTDRLPIEVHGVYPEHARHVFTDAVQLRSELRVRPGKAFNTVRPLYFSVAGPGGRGRRLVVAVPPGRDYVLHYASLVGHYLRTRAPGGSAHRARRAGGPARVLPGPSAPAQPRVVCYPVAEGSIPRWTGLTRLLRPGERVLIGYVHELAALLTAAGARVVQRGGNAYYGLARLRFPSGEQVCALGVRYSFWGCLSARLAGACRQLRISELIYAGKLGTLTGPHDIYRRLFVPSGYVHFGSPPALLDPAHAPPNPLLRRYPELDTGVHMSVGTVLEEDLQQRRYATRFAVASIDNEISQIAAALAGGGAHRTAFSAIHFATDYLHDAGERIPGVFNLTNHRRRDARTRKSAMLRAVADRLAGHYAHPLGPDDRTA